MSIPSTPSIAKVPDTVNELLRNYKKYNSRVSRSVKTARDIGKNAKKITDYMQKGNFKKVNPRLGNAITFALSLASVGLSLLTINQIGQLQQTQLNIDNIQSKDIDNSFTRSVNNTLRIRNLRKQLDDFISLYKKEKDRLSARISSSEASVTEVREQAETARKLGNDALYEVRTGRQIIDDKISELNNFVLQLRESIIVRNQELATRIAEARKIGNDALYETRVSRQKLELSLKNVQAQITQIQKRINNLEKSPALIAIRSQLKIAFNTADAAFDLANRALKVRAQPGKDGKDGKDGRPGRDGKDGKDGKDGRPGRDGVRGLAGLPGKDGKDGRPGRDGKDGKDGKDVDPKQYNELIQKISLIPPLIARVPRDTVKQMPKPLTSGQVEAAASAGVCKTTRSGGCMSNALQNTADTINKNTNNWGTNILNKLNTAANAAQLALLKKIDLKMGVQIANGGLSGAVKRIFENKLFDRAIAVTTLVTTFHNALMLSNSLVTTLFSATDNILNAVGIKIKDEKGSEIGIQQIVNNLTTNLANTLFGAENVATLNANFKKANRVYQSAANIVDSVRSMTDSVRNVTEFAAENTGRIGNALKTYQVIAPDAYNWMPEQVNSQSIWVQRLQNLEEAASGIEMVSGEVLSITQNANEIKQQIDTFNQAVEDLPPKERNNNKPIADNQTAQKAASTTPAIPEISSDADKEADE